MTPLPGLWLPPPEDVAVLPRRRFHGGISVAPCCAMFLSIPFPRWTAQNPTPLRALVPSPQCGHLPVSAPPPHPVYDPRGVAPHPGEGEGDVGEGLGGQPVQVLRRGSWVQERPDDALGGDPGRSAVGGLSPAGGMVLSQHPPVGDGLLKTPVLVPCLRAGDLTAEHTASGGYHMLCHSIVKYLILIGQ